MNSFIEKMGRNFLVAAFVPSLAYVTLAMVIFSPIIPSSLLGLLTETLTPLDQSGLVLLMLTVIVGFTLYTLNTYLYKFIEGYFLGRLFAWTRRFQQHKASKEYSKIIFLEQMIERLDKQPPHQEKLEQIKAIHYQMKANYNRIYPSSPKQALPSRFGNILRAMEAYPRERYGIDAVLFWPRLIHVMPESYYDKLDQSNNRLAFLVNCAILSFGMTVASIFASGYQFLISFYAINNISSPLYLIRIYYSDWWIIRYQQNAFLYLVSSMIMMLSLVFFYHATLPIAIQYGDLVRSSFDLFRWTLFRGLHLLPVKSYNKELSRWEAMSDFVAFGKKFDEKELLFDYSSISNETGEVSNKDDLEFKE